MAWHTVGAQFILLNESIHLTASKASLAGGGLDAGAWEKGRQMSLHSQTQKSLCPRPGHGVSIWPGCQAGGAWLGVCPW